MSSVWTDTINHGTRNLVPYPPEQQGRCTGFARSQKNWKRSRGRLNWRGRYQPTSGINEENKESVQIYVDPVNPRGEVHMTTTSEIRLDFPDVDTDEG